MDYDLTLRTSNALDNSTKEALKDFHISQTDDVNVIRFSVDNASSTLDELILQFISVINNSDTSLVMCSILEVGIYFDSKIANLNISLKDSSIKKLSNMSMSLDICCYPCSE